MSMKGWALIIIIAIAAALGYLAWGRDAAPRGEVPVVETPVSTSTPSTPSTSSTTDNDMVRKVNVVGRQLVTSPLTITGEAKGPWYFEASFPVEIRDANGALVSQHYAEAQGEWMTTGFVPFTSTISFTAPTTTLGFLVLRNDNPSGDPERDQAVIIPVRFR
jgi:hypothetical protein